MSDKIAMIPESADVPSFGTISSQLAEASLLVDDIILKNYLTKLIELELVPLDDSMKTLDDIRLFQITEMVYQNDEYSTYKFASVFNAVQNLNCSVFIIADSNGQRTDFYMGVRSLDDERGGTALGKTLRNALCGQFPGVKTSDDFREDAIRELLANIPSKSIASVSCVAHNKDEDFKDNSRFIQGLEKLALAMQGQRYTAIVLAKSTPARQLAETRRAYETIYTRLSPFANMQLNYGTNTALSVSDAFSQGTTTGNSHSTNVSAQTSISETNGTSSDKRKETSNLLRNAGSASLGVTSVITAPLTGGASIAVAGALFVGNMVLNAIDPSQKSEGSSENKGRSNSFSKTHGTSDSYNEATNENDTHTEGLTFGTSENMQLTMQNKTLINTLERIDSQLKRIDECESLGMWECAAYFLSDSRQTAEMAAGTYKALMKGEKSGVEISAVNFWGKSNKKLPVLRDYITNFIHPVFEYRSASATVPVTPSSLVSGNELAIQMGLPRKSVCGFPVIEHADFGKEVVSYSVEKKRDSFILGKVFNMGRTTEVDVRLERHSMAMHTFVTGSTGSGKSNTIYEILYQLGKLNIPFLVVEPAKGEYKNIFGKLAEVYGTNPKKSKLLKINPFRFPGDIHVLEHLDRLVELFNVCWPMYAAMPAILKDAMERAYAAVGWDVETSENPNGEVFPDFVGLLAQIEKVISESKYSAELMGNYSGALCTRVRSLTTGLNRLIFTNEDLCDEDLFGKNVIVDLSRVGSTETKSLIMGLLVMKINEYRMTSGKMNSPLTHVTILEEAHNLLKRTSTEQSQEGSNLVGKSVEMLANSIAEMRTYGEGFVIADQSPGLLDMSVIRNTNTKIILRLPEQSDRELVGFAAGLDEEQIKELSKLERGVAAIYQNDWVEPVLVKVNKCDLAETPYIYAAPASPLKIKRQIIRFLIHGRVCEKLDWNVDDIEANLDTLGLTPRQTNLVKELIDEYRRSKALELWERKNFNQLAERVTNLLDARERVENAVASSSGNDDLTERLFAIVGITLPDSGTTEVMFVSQCFLKDYSDNKSDKSVYKGWLKEIHGGATV